MHASDEEGLRSLPTASFDGARHLTVAKALTLITVLITALYTVYDNSGTKLKMNDTNR